MEKIDLANLGRGAAAELFEAAWDRVLENIMDPNTPTGKSRTITVKVTIKPDENRKTAGMLLDVTTSLAAAKGFKSNVFIGIENGERVAYENDPSQMGLFNPTKADPEKVRPIIKEEATHD